MPADAWTTTSHQKLSAHSHTDISTSVFITAEAPVSVFSQTRNERQTWWDGVWVCVCTTLMWLFVYRFCLNDWGLLNLSKFNVQKNNTVVVDLDSWEFDRNICWLINTSCMRTSDGQAWDHYISYKTYCYVKTKFAFKRHLSVVSEQAAKMSNVWEVLY